MYIVIQFLWESRVTMSCFLLSGYPRLNPRLRLPVSRLRLLYRLPLPVSRLPPRRDCTCGRCPREMERLVGRSPAAPPVPQPRQEGTRYGWYHSLTALRDRGCTAAEPAGPGEGDDKDKPPPSHAGLRGAAACAGRKHHLCGGPVHWERGISSLSFRWQKPRQD